MPSESSHKGVIIGGVVVALLALGAAAYFALRPGSQVPAAVTGEQTSLPQAAQGTVPSPATEPVATVPAAQAPATKSYTLAEVARHGSPSDCWIAISGKVLNVTDFIASGQHNPQIEQGCGIDATDLFQSVEKHGGGKAQSLFAQFTIGSLAPR